MARKGKHRRLAAFFAWDRATPLGEKERPLRSSLADFYRRAGKRKPPR
jgi:hypothetical protein